MATKFQYNEEATNTNYPLYDDNWVSQSFKDDVGQTITYVELKMHRAGSGGNVTVSIRATDGADSPVGADLAVSAAVDCSAITVSTSGEWVTFTFISPYTLVGGVTYAICARCDSVIANTIRWETDTSSPSYANGQTATSANAGSSWSTSAYDTNFRCYGDITTVPIDKTYSKELVSIAGNEVWRESTAGTMAELTDANGGIDTSIPLNAAVAFQKLFIANGTNLKIADFVNTKIVTANIGTNPPDFGTVITGTSGASMIVDYITATSSACTIYGKRTTATTFPANDPITGTNPSTSPYGTSVSFTMTAVAEVAPPHWYDWTVYGADATNYGAMPTRANQVCNFMGCLMLAGDPNYPHQWYMSRQFNPFDWLYAQDDAQSAVAGNDADAGEVGDIIKVNIPYKDDYVVHACASTLWYMTGHPCAGGTIVELDLTTGILGDRAFCWDDVGNLYMVCTTGLLRIPPGFGQPQNLTIELWPDFITDLAFNASTHRITLAFNPEDRGIHIFKTTLADGTSSAWWYDLRTEGLFPDSYSTDHGVFSAVYYQSEDPSYRKLLFGCNDGYIRFADRTAKNDDSTAIDSYVGFAPLSLSTHPRKDGIIKNIDLVSGGGASGGTYQSDSNNVLCSVHVARTAEQIIEKLKSGTTAAFTKTFTAPGYQRGNIDRRPIRGQWGGIVLSDDDAGESWSMERLIVDTKEMGRSL